MRRALASLLLALFAYPVIALAVRSDDAPTVHACCRLAGKHHCGMDAVAQDAPSGPALTPVRARCPYYPGPISFSGQFSVALVDSGESFRASSVNGVALSALPEARRADSSTTAHQKRGPPSFS
jgi:hypothetical protein